MLWLSLVLGNNIYSSISLGVETTVFNGAGRAVDTLDAAIEAPELFSEDVPGWNR